MWRLNLTSLGYRAVEVSVNTVKDYHQFSDVKVMGFPLAFKFMYTLSE